MDYVIVPGLCYDANIGYTTRYQSPQVRVVLDISVGPACGSKRYQPGAMKLKFTGRSRKECSILWIGTWPATLDELHP